MGKEAFLQAIADNWPQHVIAPGASPGCKECFSWLDDCADPSESDMDSANEGGFSWCACDSCGSSLGGNRYPAHAIHKEAFGPDAKRPNDVTHISICADCLRYHANGDIPEDWES